MHRGGHAEKRRELAGIMAASSFSGRIWWPPPGCPAVLAPTAVKLCAGAAAAAVEHAVAVTSDCAGLAAQCGCIPCSHLFGVQMRGLAGRFRS